eukprot:TRINITY_DN173_c0_g1_i1.p1 TRINITY_DN173_c0_g1~~TRINITY_DN173_c0_g1_i1.p1  ORF type:complete len:165 (+),score=26.37 TRINITY_DN173_c0_g1_i1:71-565(+)
MATVSFSAFSVVMAALTSPSFGSVLERVGWKPEPDSGYELYVHPQGSGLVMPCPVESHTSPDGCAAAFKGKADGEQCPQLTCPKALGKTMKLVCGGGCCPVCWAPDHVVAMDRHTAEDTGNVVATAPQAPPHCAGAVCFEPICAEGKSKGHVQGDCCYSCVPGR